MTYNNTKSKSHRNSFELFIEYKHNNLFSVLLLSLVNIVDFSLLCTHTPQFAYRLERPGIYEKFTT